MCLSFLMTMTRTRSPIELFWTAKECFPFHLSILSFEVWRESYVLSAFHPDGKLLTKLTRSFFTDLLTIKSFFLQLLFSLKLFSHNRSEKLLQTPEKSEPVLADKEVRGLIH